MTAHNSTLPTFSHHQLHFYQNIKGQIPDSDPNLHACAHLYASDRNGLFLIANSLGFGNDISAIASISHTVVFHVPSKGLRVGKGDWFCQDAFSERSGGGRGLHTSKIWDGNGVHIASSWQDGLLRAGQSIGGKEGREEHVKAKI